MEIHKEIKINNNIHKWVFVFGMLGIIGALLTSISDVILLGRATDAASFFKKGTETMAGLEQWRITAGTFIGVFVLPLQLCGLVLIAYGMGLIAPGKETGKKIRAIPIISLGFAAHGLIMGVAFHTAYAFIESAWRLRMQSGESIFADDIIKRFGLYWSIIIVAIIIDLFIFSAGYIHEVLKGNTSLPEWFAIMNPLVIFILMLPVVYIIPEPVGGYIAPIYLNLSTMTFYILVLTQLTQGRTQGRTQGKAKLRK